LATLNVGFGREQIVSILFDQFALIVKNQHLNSSAGLVPPYLLSPAGELWFCDAAAVGGDYRHHLPVSCMVSDIRHR